MSANRRHSPWAYQNEQLVCPRCQSDHIFRLFDCWGRVKSLQMFECTSCGKKFYIRGVDSYRPTFST